MRRSSIHWLMIGSLVLLLGGALVFYEVRLRSERDVRRQNSSPTNLHSNEHDRNSNSFDVVRNLEEMDGGKHGSGRREAIDGERSRELSAEIPGQCTQEQLESALSVFSRKDNDVERSRAIQLVEKFLEFHPDESAVLEQVKSIALADYNESVRVQASMILYYQPSQDAFDSFVQSFKLLEGEAKRQLLLFTAGSGIVPNCPAYRRKLDAISKRSSNGYDANLILKVRTQTLLDLFVGLQAAYSGTPTGELVDTAIEALQRP